MTLTSLMHDTAASKAPSKISGSDRPVPMLDGIDRIRELVSSLDTTSNTNSSNKSAPRENLKAYATRVQDECDALLARVTAATASADKSASAAAASADKSASAPRPSPRGTATGLPPKPTTDTVQGRRLASGNPVPADQLSITPNSGSRLGQQSPRLGSGSSTPTTAPSPPRPGMNSNQTSPRVPSMTSPRISPRTQSSPKPSNLFSQWAHPESFSPSSLRRRVETLERQMSDLTNQNVDMTGELATRQKQIQHLTNHNNFLQQQLKQVVAESSSFQNQVAQLTSHMQLLLNRSYVQKAKLDDTQAKLSKAQEEKAELEAKVNALLGTTESTPAPADDKADGSLKAGSSTAASCTICSKQSSSAALVPCGHKFCGTCSAGLSTCPDCNVPVMTRVDLLES